MRKFHDGVYLIMFFGFGRRWVDGFFCWETLIKLIVSGEKKTLCCISFVFDLYIILDFERLITQINCERRVVSIKLLVPSFKGHTFPIS